MNPKKLFYNRMSNHLKKNYLKIFIAFVLLITKNVCVCAQLNHVPNNSFEQFTTCPNSSTLQNAFNSKPDYWYKPDKRAAIYYNNCASVGSNMSTPSHGLSC
ncbi:MAG: hypothetical protein V9E96_19435 [Chitinophagaceae bacterium]|jgi:hypothetical protein